MAKVTLPIDGGFYQSESLPVSAQQCINWYVNIPQSGALSEANLFGAPGLLQLQTTGVTNQVNRGAHVMSGIPYFVNGDSLYRLNRVVTVVDGVDVESFTLDNLGLISGSGRVSISDNGTQLMILVPGGAGYIFTESPDTLTQITDADFTANGNPQYVVFIDGYFSVTTDTKKWIISALNDGLSWNALDFSTAESDPDNIVAPLVHKNQIFIAGSETIEAFQNLAQGADFPFQRSGLFIDKGVFAPFSIINSNNSFMFIGGGVNESPAIWAFTGSGVNKISTTAIDSILQRFTSEQIQESFSYAYAQKGAYFVAFSLPTTTLVIDTITGKWHERKSQVENSVGITNTIRSRVNSLVTAYGRVIVGDSEDGRIGHLDPDTYTEYGAEIIRTFVTQPFFDKGNAVFVSSLEVTMESGVGNDASDNPQIRMSQSRDGKTFSDERSRAIGRIGEYNRRCIWRRLGRVPRFRLFKFVLSDAVKPVFIRLDADLILGEK
jgi:hypothetical protein